VRIGETAVGERRPKPVVPRRSPERRHQMKKSVAIIGGVAVVTAAIAVVWRAQHH
jgi:hypothetical protein